MSCGNSCNGRQGVDGGHDGVRNGSLTQAAAVPAATASSAEAGDSLSQTFVAVDAAAAGGFVDLDTDDESEDDEEELAKEMQVGHPVAVCFSKSLGFGVRAHHTNN